MIRILFLVCATLLSAMSLAETNVYGETNPGYDGKPSVPRLAVPPAFSAKTEPEIALCDYPLGVITKQMAFSRHGSPHKIVTLANNKEGWVYEIPRARGSKTYTLEFDDGVVIDVIYEDDGLGTGVTATVMQGHKAKPMTEPQAIFWTP